MRNNIFLLIVCCVFCVSCQNNKEEIQLKGAEYFPDKINVTRTYQIDSFYYDDFTGTTDTVSFICKEEITDKLVDLSNDSIIRVQLSRYNEKKMRWDVFKVFSRKIVGNYAIENIDNIPELKLLFPISQGKTVGTKYAWDLNMFNDRGKTIVKYVKVFQSFHNGIRVYNDCVNTALTNVELGIVNNVREEVYANGIGLVYRHIDQSNYQSVTGKRAGFEVFVRLR